MSLPFEIPAMIRFMPSSLSLSALLSSRVEISLSLSSDVSKYVEVDEAVPVSSEMSRADS